MRTGWIAIWAMAMLGLAIGSPLAAPNEGSGAGDGKLLADSAEPALEPSGVPADSLDRINRDFVAISWRPRTLGDPDALIEQAVKDAVDRAHRRISPADVGADRADGQPTMSELDSGWDDFSALTPEHQLRRLRQLSNLLAERAPSTERLIEIDTRPQAVGVDTVVAGRTDDMALLRAIRDSIKSLQNGTFFTPERIAILVAALLAILMLARLRHLGGR